MVGKKAAPARVVRTAKVKKKSTWVKWVKVVFALFFVAFVTLAISSAVFFMSKLSEASEKVKQLDQLIDAVAIKPTQIVSSDGKVLYESIKFRRTPMKLDDIPPIIINATLAAEDKRFYAHSGIDEWALFRQIVTNVREGRIAGGASTLTMQLAKRAYSNSEKTFSRKVDDMALALQIERSFTKHQILELYLNQVYYGSNAYGVASAAQVYFGKPLDKLSIAEAAMLARCVRRPSDENPFINLDRSIANRNVVLEIMRQENMITDSELEKAKKEKVKLAPHSEQGSTIKDCPYFVRYILDEIRKMPEFNGIDISEGGYRIETTVDTRLQADSDHAARNLVRNFRGYGVRAAAFVLARRDGAVLAMTGGLDFTTRQFNMVTQGSRQPGSAFKPFVYSMAFDRGDLAPESPISNATYTKRNWTVRGNGSTPSVKAAITYSMNAAAARAMELVGPDYFVSRAKRVFGFPEEFPAVPSLVLGSYGVSPMEMCQAYSVFQTGGDRVKPFGILRITGPQDRVIYSYAAGSNVAKTDLSTHAIEDIDSCLRSVVLHGSAAPSGVGSVPHARGKTGTTNDNRDAWFCGYTNSYVGVGWVSGERIVNGKFEYPEMSDYVMGGTVTARMWRDVVRNAQDLLGESSDDPERHYAAGNADYGSRRAENGNGRIPVDVSAAGDPDPASNGTSPDTPTNDNSSPRKPRPKPRPKPGPSNDPGTGGGLPDGPGDVPPDDKNGP